MIPFFLAFYTAGCFHQWVEVRWSLTPEPLLSVWLMFAVREGHAITQTDKLVPVSTCSVRALASLLQWERLK